MKNFWKTVAVLGVAYAYGRLLYSGICKLCGIQVQQSPSLITVNKYTCTDCNAEQKEENNEQKEN